MAAFILFCILKVEIISIEAKTFLDSKFVIENCASICECADRKFTIKCQKVGIV